MFSQAEAEARHGGGGRPLVRRGCRQRGRVRLLRDFCLGAPHCQGEMKLMPPTSQTSARLRLLFLSLSQTFFKCPAAQISDGMVFSPLYSCRRLARRQRRHALSFQSTKQSPTPRANSRGVPGALVGRCVAPWAAGVVGVVAGGAAGLGAARGSACSRGFCRV